MLALHAQMPALKPWPNGDASWRKLTQVEDLGQLATSFGQGLRALTLTCDDLRSLCTQVDASFSPFGHPTQVNASWVTSINLLLANKIEDSLPENVFILRLACTCEETCEPFGHPKQVSTQVQLVSTCDYLPVRLAKA